MLVVHHAEDVRPLIDLAEQLQHAVVGVADAEEIASWEVALLEALHSLERRRNPECIPFNRMARHDLSFNGAFTESAVASLLAVHDGLLEHFRLEGLAERPMGSGYDCEAELHRIRSAEQPTAALVADLAHAVAALQSLRLPRRGRQPSTPEEERDQFCFRQLAGGAVVKTVLLALQKRDHWPLLMTHKAVMAAANRWANLAKLPVIAKRPQGRRPRAE